MYDHYKSGTYVSWSAGSIIAKALHDGSLGMCSVLRAMRALEYFGHRRYRPWLVEILEGYLSSFGHSSKTRIDASVQQEYISYLNEPDNLFIVCSILAVGNSDLLNEYRKKGIKENILAPVWVWRGAPGCMG